MKIINIVGARPNFMKMAPIIETINKNPDKIQHLLVHTGQHYDEKMSKSFFHDLGMPRPDIDLEVGSGSYAEQTARIMISFEKVCLQEKPDLVIVVGDVKTPSQPFAPGLEMLSAQGLPLSRSWHLSSFASCTTL